MSKFPKRETAQRIWFLARQLVARQVPPHIANRGGYGRVRAGRGPMDVFALVLKIGIVAACVGSTTGKISIGAPLTTAVSRDGAIGRRAGPRPVLKRGFERTRAALPIPPFAPRQAPHFWH